MATPRFLVAAPVGRDGELICSLLNASGYAAEHVVTIRALEKLESAEILGLIFTDEALATDGFEALRIVVEGQPVWSDLPLLLLTSGASIPAMAPSPPRSAWSFAASSCLTGRCARSCC